MGGRMVNAVARYPRIFTVVAFTLLMDFNRVLSPAFRARSARESTPPFRRNIPHALASPGVRDRRAEGMSRDPAVAAATDQGRRSLRNFSRNRPETTNLNHQ